MRQKVELCQWPPSVVAGLKGLQDPAGSNSKCYPANLTVFERWQLERPGFRVPPVSEDGQPTRFTFGHPPKYLAGLFLPLGKKVGRHRRISAYKAKDGPECRNFFRRVRGAS